MLDYQLVMHAARQFLEEEASETTSAVTGKAVLPAWRPGELNLKLF